MDEQYERIYDDLYTGRWSRDFYERRFGPGRFSEDPALEARVREVIDSADARLRAENMRLRSDAKAMLLLNFTSMIALPLMLHGGEIGYLDHDLGSDVDILINNARRDDDGITAHALIDSLTRNWTELRLANLRLWGAKPRYQ